MALTTNKKITVVGSGNAGCITALYYAYHGKSYGVEVEMIHDPNKKHELVGQATIPSQPRLLWQTLGTNWYTNEIKAIPKEGILYENWGKSETIFHDFPLDTHALHLSPKETRSVILNSGYFKVREQENVKVSEIDSDYVFDCTGKPSDYSGYTDLVNPLNSVILGKPKEVFTKPWTRCVATPDGWCFIIPTLEDSTSYPYSVGYLYNNKKTNPDAAEKNMLEMFDVEVTSKFSFKNYVTNNFYKGNILFNGNKMFFLEPLESTSIGAYQQWATLSFQAIVANKISLEKAEDMMRVYIKNLERFILWHYQNGSKYNTPFWNYCKKLYVEDEIFDKFLEQSKISSCDQIRHPLFTQHSYGQWSFWSFKNWYEGVMNDGKN
jgi:hypothetical protein